MGCMKNYLLTVLEKCSEEKFGQDAIEWAIVSGHIKLTYDLDTDVKQIMGDVAATPSSPGNCGGAPQPHETNYDRLIEAYRRTTEEHGAALLDLYHASGLMEEILRQVPFLPAPARNERSADEKRHERELVEA